MKDSLPELLYLLRDGQVRGISAQALRKLARSLSVLDAELLGIVFDGITPQSDQLQAIIDENPGASIKVGSSLSQVLLLDKPIVIESPARVVIDCTVKVQDGSIRPLLADMEQGATQIHALDADQHFAPGQQVCIVDDNRQLQGGSEQVRRFSDANYVEAVDGNSITLRFPADPSNRGTVTVSANGVVGHAQSAFVVKSPGVSIGGRGVIDVNGENQNWEVFSPVATDPDLSGEDTTFGSGIATYRSQSDGFHLFGSLTIKNALLHNLSLRGADNVRIDSVECLDAHDKNILVWSCSGLVAGFLKTGASLYEDGLILYQGVKDAYIERVEAEDAPRSGVNSGTAAVNITFGSIYTKNCTVNLRGERISCGDIKIEGSRCLIGGGGAPENRVVIGSLTVKDATRRALLVLSMDSLELGSFICTTPTTDRPVIDVGEGVGSVLIRGGVVAGAGSGNLFDIKSPTIISGMSIDYDYLGNPFNATTTDNLRLNDAFGWQP